MIYYPVDVDAIKIGIVSYYMHKPLHLFSSYITARYT